MAQSILQVFCSARFCSLGIGMSMIFGIVKLTNLAHGELLILAAYLSAVLTQHWGTIRWYTILIVAPIMFVAGYLMQRGLINRVIGTIWGKSPRF
jgi:branched-chain amino acid transport system permease protein